MLPTKVLPTAQQTGGDRRLQRFGSGRVDHARGDHAGREPVLHQRHQHGIEQRRLRGGRTAAGDLEEHHLREADLADELLDQIDIAHVDRLLRVAGDMSLGTGLLSHDWPLFGWCGRRAINATGLF